MHSISKDIMFKTFNSYKHSSNETGSIMRLLRMRFPVSFPVPFCMLVNRIGNIHYAFTFS